MIVDVQELEISQVINENIIDLDMKATTKLEAIERLIQLLYMNQCIGDEKNFKEDVLWREQQGVTGLGQGVAIPHGKSDSVLKTSIAIGRTKNPIVWDTLDGKPINIIFLFAVKNTDANTLHIKLLQKVAILLADDEVVHQFQTIKNKRELINLLSKK